jgi:hypothetical protein
MNKATAMCMQRQAKTLHTLQDTLHTLQDTKPWSVSDLLSTYQQAAEALA